MPANFLIFLVNAFVALSASTRTHTLSSASQPGDPAMGLPPCRQSGGKHGSWFCNHKGVSCARKSCVSHEAHRDTLGCATGWEAPRYGGSPGDANPALPGHGAGGKRHGGCCRSGSPSSARGWIAVPSQPAVTVTGSGRGPCGSTGGVHPRPPRGREGGHRLPARRGWERRQPAAVRR